MNRWIRYTGWTLLTVIGLLVICGLLAGYVFDGEIKTALVRELNKNLEVPIEVSEQDIRFSVFRDFPDATLSFDRLKMGESIDGSERDLMRIGRLSLRFSMRDLLRKRYTIRRIDLEDGELSLRRLADGRVNYHFWKTPQEPASQKLDLDLAHLVLKNVRIFYSDDQLRQQADLHIIKGIASGKLLGEEFDLTLNIEGQANNLQEADGKFVFADPFTVSGNLSGNTVSGQLGLEKVVIETGNIRFLVNGNINTKKGPTLDVELTGEGLELASLLDLATSSGWKIPALGGAKSGGKGWSGKGELTLKGKVNGAWGKGKIPVVSLEFGLKNGSLKHSGLGVDLDQLHFSGKFRNSDGSRLVLNDVFVRQGGVSLNMDLSATEFKNPFIQLQADGEVLLATLTPFLPSEIYGADGRIILNDLRINGRISDLREGSGIPADASGSISFENTHCRWHDRDWSINSGKISLDGDRLILDELEFSGAESRLTLDGHIRNGLAAFLLAKDQAPLPYLEGRIDASVFDLENLMQAIAPVTTAGSQRDPDRKKMKLPRISGNLIASVDEFRYGDVRLNDLRSSWRFTPGYWRSDNLKANAMSGSALVQVAVRQTPEAGILLDLEGTFQEVKVEDCFRQFHDFGQDELTSRNLKGRVSGTLHHLQAEWDPSGKFLPAELLVHSDVEIRDGALINYAPVEALSRFIRVEELRNIRFATLKNTIQIVNENIHIPIMDIQSSVLNLSLTGTHDFSGWLDYQAKINLFEILGKKFSRTQPTEAAFAEAEKSGALSLYVSMKGRADNLQMEYNRKEARKMFQQEGKREGLFRLEEKEKKKKTEWSQEGEEPEFLDWGEEDEP